MTKESLTVLDMNMGLRDSLISDHQFFVDQAKARLFDQFNDLSIQSESQKISQETWEQIEGFYDPDKHDLLEFSEVANDQGYERYRLLSEMRDHTRFSILAALFHSFEKSLKDWIARDLFTVFKSEGITRRVWGATLEELYTLLKEGGVNVRVSHIYKDLRNYQLIVNVYKHGEGRSLDDLRNKAPQFIVPDDEGGFHRNFPLEFFDHSYLRVTDADFDQLTGAIAEFWKEMPTYIRTSDFKKFPKWLNDAAK
ncbi:hypothetical protein [Halocynthiibacter styelae]|uniref:Uncharacterized protein n=1 Tax=Halocynthiibacter styelae TaxID=2761955 RepID=A0A8J7IUY9_9RHOB|nr:hypothetical protein [Paenihalocynthiibacter styelae]MBI1492040.1 hypothetical protein [Paenihalocynthiibacter styelae]